MKTATEFLAAFSRLPKVSRIRVVSEILEMDLMTDANLCESLQISAGQLRGCLRNGPPRGRSRNVLDLRTVRHIRVGGSRMWFRSSLMAAINGDTE